MENRANPLVSANRIKSFFDALLLLSIALFGFLIIGPFLGLLLSLPFIETSLIEIESVLQNLYSSADGKTLIYFMQGGATIGMVGLPALYTRFKYKELYQSFSEQQVLPIAVLLSMVVTFTFMGFNSIFIEWNANITFPDSMQAFENWARQTEEAAAQMTVYLTDFDGLGTFFISLIIMAVFPSIAEEFVFRGLIQRKLHEGFNNIHIAIWVSAVLFSAIHMQFFGFIPRMLLGALFGYLYYWSGNLIIPIAAHFFNNAFTLSMIYLYNINIIDYDIQDAESPTLAGVLLFSIITFGLVYYFRKLYSKPLNG